MRSSLASRAGLLFIPIVAAMGGCSTLSRGTNQTVTFQTDSPDATIYVGKQTLHAPAQVKLSRLICNRPAPSRME